MNDDAPSEGSLAAANETYLEATGAALLRELRYAIEFALAEPAFFPPLLDEDTGEFAPVPNDGPRICVRSLTAKAMRHPSASRLLASRGWTDDTCDGDLQTMLDHLSPA
jgi:hypothetical protein